MQQLKIRNFGPLREVELNIKDYMIFIGPQASGKSTILKLLYIFRSLREEVFRTVADVVEGINADPLPELKLKEHIVNKFKSFWDDHTRYGEFFLKYDYGNDKVVTIYQRRKSIQVAFSDKLEQEIRKIFAGLGTYITERYKDATQEHKAKYYAELDGYIYSLFDREKIPIYIPAGRVMAYGIYGRYLSRRLDNAMKMFIQQIAEMRPLYYQDLEKMVNGLQTYGFRDRDSIDMAIVLIRQILGGNYVYKQNNERIKLGKKAYIEMPFASTGQQEALWLMLQLFTTMLSSGDYFIIIDEPEAHLYPLAQKYMMELIALVANYSENEIVMATNSPTVLKTVNNQVYAKQKKTAVVHPKYRLEGKILAAYILEDKGLRSIVDSKKGMIMERELDSVGDMLDKELRTMEGREN
jgi:predicted ATPase